MLKDSFSKLKHEEMLCVDEQVVPYKGKLSIKQYNPMKPKKWGFKIYVLSGVYGLVHNFEIHTGPIDACLGQPDLKASGNIVINLLVNVSSQKWHKLYFDNWYTSLESVKTLFTQRIACVGTVRSNRLKNIELPTDKVMKKQGRGLATLLTTNVDNVELRVVKWFDNRGVTLLSSYVAVNPLSTVQRWDRKTKSKINVTRPSIVSTYNSFMGGVDLLDCLLSL
nr:piggyBac transposable element-derived protein 4-like [Hydra vulgaris]